MIRFSFSLRRLARHLETPMDAPGLEPPFCAASGTLVWKDYRNGDSKLKLRLRDLPLPEAAELALVVSGHTLARLAVTGRRLKLNLDTRKGDRLPPVSEGTGVQLLYGDRVILEGQLYPP